VWLRDLSQAAAAAVVTSDGAAQRLIAGLLDVLWLLTLLGIVALPFSAFRDWTLDRRYSLDRIPFRVWLSTHLKGALIALLLAIGGLIVLQASVALSPEWWWAIAALTFAAAQIGVTMVVPWLLPFFARLRPLKRPALVGRLDRLATRAGAGASLSVYEWEDDAAARRAQAALVGLGRTRRVLLSDTLLEAFTDDEVEVIVAHELAHHVHRDLWMAALSRLLTLLLGFAVTDAVLDWLHASPAIYEGPTDLAALPLIVLTVGGIGVIASPLVLALARRQERRADAFSLDMTGNPDAFVTVLRRLAALNLAEDRPPQMVDLFFASHPSVTERVAAARAWRPRASPS
jgi:STE24 endopeptidase